VIVVMMMIMMMVVVVVVVVVVVMIMMMAMMDTQMTNLEQSFKVYHNTENSTFLSDLHGARNARAFLKKSL
jgi:flagellar basal body-associated protein FliL